MDQKYNTFSQRFGAGFVDGLVLLPVMFVDMLVYSQVDLTWLIVAWLPISYSVYWLYSVLLHGMYGQTLGKRFLKIRVVDYMTEGPITMWQAVWRDSFLIIANTLGLGLDLYIFLSKNEAAADTFYFARVVLGYATLFWFVTEIVTCLLNSKRRALHDLIAGTVVVRTDA